jgi:ACS family allantoate permease-like MFS transporter
MAAKLEVSQLDETVNVEQCERASDEKRAMMPKSGVDDALQMALDSQEETWTEEEERRVLWKIDLVLIPLVCDTQYGHCIIPSTPFDIDAR